MGNINTKSNAAIITEDWVDVDIDDSASEYDSEEEEDMECDGKLLRSLLWNVMVSFFALFCVSLALLHTHAYNNTIHHAYVN